MRDRYVHVTPRLEAALDLLSGYDSVADVGCDHGRLTAALLQRNACRRVIATDISEPSLEKAKNLIDRIGKSDAVSFRAGDGLRVLEPNECDAIAILGMGGTLMNRILDACAIPLAGAKAIVLQPMRAQSDIRAYLYQNQYRILADRIVYDHGRYYQIFKAEPGDSPDPIPDGFPESFFDVGYRSFSDRDPLLQKLCEQQLFTHEKRLRAAAGSDGERILAEKIRALRMILDALKED